VLTASVYSISSDVTYNSPTTYTISITPNKIIPQNGYVLIKFPSEIELSGSTLASCQTYISSTTITLSTCTITATSPPTIKVPGFSSSSYSDVGNAYRIILGGFINPRTTAVTSSFEVSSFDTDGYAIEALTTGITTQMASFPDLTSFTVTPSSQINGASNDYKITVLAVIPILSTDKLIFTFPSEITLPSSISCGTGTLITAVSCSASG
jgi:hypothetical protein